MTSVFFKRDLAHSFNRAGYRRTEWIHSFDIFYSADLPRVMNGYILYELCRSGNQRLVDHFILTRPEFDDWDHGLSGAVASCNILLIRQMIRLGAKDIGGVANRAPTLQVLMELDTHVPSTNHPFSIRYKWVARCAVQRDSPDILRFALEKRESLLTSARANPLNAVHAAMLEYYIENELNPLLADACKKRRDSYAEIVAVLLEFGATRCSYCGSSHR